MQVVFHPPLAVFLIAVGLVLVGCGQDDAGDDTDLASEVDSVEQSTVSDCQPEPGFDVCYSANTSQLDYWQSTLPDPDWRTVSSHDDPDIDYEVRITADALNAGIIPTAPGQGDYGDWAEFQAHLSDLIGVDVSEDSALLAVEGMSVKYNDQGEISSASTGAFIYDSLTNDDGQIIVDGEDETDEFVGQNMGYDRYRVIYDDGTSQSILEGDDEDLDSVSTNSDSVAELTSGDWYAELATEHRATTNAATFHMSQISNLREGPWGCTFIIYDEEGEKVVEKSCHKADRLSILSQIPGGSPEILEAEVGHVAASLKLSHVTPPAERPAKAGCAYGEALFDDSADEWDDDVVYTSSMDSRDCNLRAN